MKGQILLVDDNFEFLDSLKDVLEDGGYQTATAVNGEEALRLVSMHEFDAVVMDIRMPGMNGVECFIEMKKVRPDIRALLMTAYSVENLIRQALDEGVSAVLSKPLDLPLFFQHIKVLQHKRKGGMILVADDDKMFCDNLADILLEENYSVATAYDGEEAVRLAESRPFDILLADMKLPILNGLEVYRSIKRIRPEIIAVIISGHAVEMSAFISQMLSESAYTCLRKPVDMGRLIELLDDICITKRAGLYRKPSGMQP